MGSKNRPPPLRINKESQRIRKPPLRLPIIQHRQPTIIHTYSPKVIQTDPNEFMSLVQRLTGRGVDAGSALNVHTNSHCTINPTALPNPVASASADLYTAADRDQLDRVNVGVLISPRSSFHQVQAHDAVLNQGYDHTFSLTHSPLYLRSPAASCSVLASPARLWSPIPTPNVWSQRFLADLQSLSPGKQGSANSLLLPSPRNGALMSPRLWSPLPTPNMYSQRFLADLPSLSLERQGRGDDLLLPSPRLLSPRSRYGGILPSPGALS